jgi:hypothetical protein
MTRTLVIAASLVVSASIVALALLRMAGELHAVSRDLAALTHQVTQVAADVRSLADDVAVLTEAMTAEDGALDEPCPPGDDTPAGDASARLSSRR